MTKSLVLRVTDDILPPSLAPPRQWKRLINSLHSNHPPEQNPRPNHVKSLVHSSLAEQLATCTTLPQLTQIHAHLIRTNFFESHLFPLHWNNLIRSYTRNNAPRSATNVYLAMSRAGVSPDCYTLPIILKAFCQCYSIRAAIQLHAVMIRLGLEVHEFCESGLIRFYCKAGEFVDAYKVFDGNSERKLGSWNAMIAGLSQCGRDRDAVGAFLRMKRSGFTPDDVTMVSVMVACGSLSDLDLALQLHKFVLEATNPVKDNVLMLNSVIDAYGKCGRMDLACRVFSQMDGRNVSTWTSLIVGYAVHGYAHDALKYFGYMRESGMVPNHVTFLGVLSACAHGVMVQEGKHYFQMMKNLYGIEPRMKHFGCMVDLLGRSGLLEEARKMVEEMPMQANVVIWGSFLGACERYSDVKMGEWVAQHLLQLEPWNDGVYVVLSNIYACRNMWEEVGRIREVMKQRSLAKTPGSSCPTTSD